MPVSLDFSERFSGNVSAYFLEGDWPQGLQIDANGVVSGNPVGQGLYKNLRVRAMSALGHKAAYTSYFEMVVTAFGALVPAFNGEMTGVIAGVGGLATTRSTISYVLDHEGIYREIGANEPMYSGGRVVTNTLRYSEDFTSGTWTSTDITKVGETVIDGVPCMEVHFDAVVDARLVHSNYLAWATPIIFKAYMRAKSVTEVLNVHAGNTGKKLNGEDLTITADEFKWYTVAGAVTGSGGAFGLFDSIGNGADIYLAKMQFEVVDGQVDTTTPSEYVPTTSAAATKVFATANGNTVASNVVTEGVGAPLAEIPYLSYVPAATNSVLYSNDQTNAVWVKEAGVVTAQDQIGVTGEANTATKVESIGTNFDAVRDSYSISGDSVLVVYLKKTAANSYPGVQISSYTIQVNTKDGVTRFSNGTGSVEVVSEGTWWKILLEINQTGTEDIRIYGQLSSDGLVNDANAVGECVVGNAELYVGKTIAEVRGLPPIFTTTAAVSTNETLYSADDANDNNTKAVWYAEIVLPYPSNSLNSAGFIGIKSDGLNSILYENGTSFRSFGASSTPNNSRDLAQDASGKIATLYSDTDNQQSVIEDGEYGAVQAFTSIVNTANEIRIGKYSTNPYKIRNLLRYNIPNYQDGKDKIDDLME